MQRFTGSLVHLEESGVGIVAGDEIERVYRYDEDSETLEGLFDTELALRMSFAQQAGRLHGQY